MSQYDQSSLSQMTQEGGRSTYFWLGEVDSALETAGLEFYLNTSGAVEEDEAFANRQSLEHKSSAVAFSANTIEVNSDTGSLKTSQIFDEYG